MITVTRIGKHLGAEISGVDVAQPLDDNTCAPNLTHGQALKMQRPALT